MKNQLQKGDVVYQELMSGSLIKHEIERVTKTLAVSKSGVRFRREIHGNYVYKAARDNWTTNIFKLEDDELKAAYRLQMLMKWLESNYKKFTLEQLEFIYSSVQKQPTENERS